MITVGGMTAPLIIHGKEQPAMLEALLAGTTVAQVARDHRIAETTLRHAWARWRRDNPDQVPDGSLAHSLGRGPGLPEAPQAPRRPTPSAWDVGIAWDDDTSGTITTGPIRREDDDGTGGRSFAEQMLRDAGIDPSRYELVNADISYDPARWHRDKADIGVNHTAYTAPVTAYKFRFRERLTTSDGEVLDLGELRNSIRKWKPRRQAARTPTCDETFMVSWADWQLGKGDGDGVVGTTAALEDALQATIDRVRDLRRIGRSIGNLWLAGLGDPIEGVCGNYSTQPFTVQLNHRDQINLGIEMKTLWLKELAPMFDRVVMTDVPCNHTENRQNGKKVTDDADSYGLLITEQVARVARENSALDHVQFVIPRDELVVTLEASGVIVATTHMHQASAGSTPQQKAEKWWAGQAFGRQAAGEARILVSAHYHHFSTVEIAEGRTHFQCPSMEADSKWWRDAKGLKARRGTLTMVLSDERAATGYCDVEIV